MQPRSQTVVQNQSTLDLPCFAECIASSETADHPTFTERDKPKISCYYPKMTSNEAQIQRLHSLACQRRDNGYIDPNTGFFVLSAHYLNQRGACCGSGCRHCPYSGEEQSRAGRAVITGEFENPLSRDKQRARKPSR